MIYHNINKCRGCGHDVLKTVFAMEPMPLAGEFSKDFTQATKAELLPTTLVQCEFCSAIQTLESVSNEVLYKEYNYDSSTIPALVKHFTQYTEYLNNLVDKVYTGINKNISLLEVGSNSNALLLQLPKNWHIVGVDPSDVAARAYERGVNRQLEFYNNFFDLELVRAKGLENKFDIITGSNCFSHCENIQEIFQSAYLCLKENGFFILEVKDVEVLLENLSYDDYYAEHCVNWDIAALKKCLGLLKFEMVEMTKLPFHGGLIRAVFQKRTHKISTNHVKDYSERFKLLQSNYNKRYDTLIAKELLKSKHNVCFGASGRGNVFLNSVPEIEFKYCVDESPARCGRVIPHVMIPIVPKSVLENDKYAKNCLVTAWTYFDNISKNNSHLKVNWQSYFPQIF